MRILVVEDSEEYQKIIKRTLSEHEITCFSSAEDASECLHKEIFDLALVDLILPKKSGHTLIGEIQSMPNAGEMPVICLTGQKEITDKVTAFSLGADDYITKPFDPIELKARVESKLKKKNKKTESEQKTFVGGIEIDHARHRVSVISSDLRHEVHLTQTEFKILSCLARRPEQVYTRDQLLVAAWGEDARVLDRVVDAHVCLLRKKLGSHSHYVKSVTGIGYKLVPSERKKKAA